MYDILLHPIQKYESTDIKEEVVMLDQFISLIMKIIYIQLIILDCVKRKKRMMQLYTLVIITDFQEKNMKEIHMFYIQPKNLLHFIKREIKKIKFNIPLSLMVASMIYIMN